MRIDRLELRAFGPFTGTALDFARGEQGLHLIHGPNEAGKSSALRALKAALFDIPGQTKDDFIHEYKSLRLGMTLRDRSGATLAFVRRKANKNKLMSPDESATLADDALAAFLGGINEEEFGRVFGLDHEGLRRGGDVLLQSGDGIAAAFVGAALGIKEMRSVRESIRAELGKLFSPRGSVPRINAAVATYKDLDKRLKSDSLSQRDWSDARRELEFAKRAREAARKELEVMRERRAEHAFVQRNRSRIARMLDLTQQLEALADLPDLSRDFDARRSLALEDRRGAEVELALLVTEIAGLQEELRSGPIDFSLLDHAAEIENLRDIAPQIANAADKKRDLDAALAASTTELSALASEVSCNWPLSREELAVIVRAEEHFEPVDRLLNELARIRTELREVDRRIRRHEEREQDTEALLEAEPAASDHSELQRAVNAARKLGEVDRKLAKLRLALVETDTRLADDLRALTSFTGSIADLAAAAVPGAALLDEFQRRFSMLEEDERLDQRKAAEWRAQRNQFDADADRLSRSGAVPSEDELRELRDRRLAQWRLVRRAWLDRAEVEAEAAEFDADRPLAEAFPRSIEKCDELADRMRLESERVAQLAERRRQCLQIDRDLADLEQRVLNRRRSSDELWAEWRVIWSQSGFVASSWPAMRDVLKLRNEILERWQGRQSLAAELEAAEGEARAASAAIRAAGFNVAAPDLGLEGLLVAAEAQLAAFDEAAARRKSLEQDLRARRKDLAEEKDQRERHAADLEDWRSKFAGATRAFTFASALEPDEVRSRLQRMARLARGLKESQSWARERAAIERNEADFESRCASLRAAAAAEVEAVSSVEFVRELAALLSRRRTEHAARQRVESELQRRVDRKRQLDIVVADATRRLDDLAREAGLEGPGGLADLMQRVERKTDLIARLENDRTDLLTESASFEEASARVARYAGRDIDADLRLLEESVERTTQEVDRANEVAAHAQKVFDDCSAATGAEALAEERAATAAGLVDDVAAYVRLLLADQLLTQALERFRGRHETPTLGLAAARFNTLTRGRYDRIETEVDDQGKSYFQVRETEGAKLKTLDQLSDGTRDQLHLALVLGSLEHRFAGGGEPMPLVLDDVLVHFDDDRSAAALATLADFAATTQVLLFSHHRRIVDQALELGESRGVFVHELGA